MPGREDVTMGGGCQWAGSGQLLTLCETIRHGALVARRDTLVGRW